MKVKEYESCIVRFSFYSEMETVKYPERALHHRIQVALPKLRRETRQSINHLREIVAAIEQTTVQDICIVEATRCAPAYVVLEEGEVNG